VLRNRVSFLQLWTRVSYSVISRRLMVAAPVRCRRQKCSCARSHSIVGPEPWALELLLDQITVVAVPGSWV